MPLPILPIGATVGATLIGAGALQTIGERTGISNVAESYFPAEQPEASPVQDLPSNDDGDGFGGVILGLAVFIAVLVFGRTVIQEVI
jgi:hypothetical protein